MNLNIRPMTEGDRAAVFELLRATTEFKPFEVKVAEEICDCYLSDPVGSGYQALVADWDGVPAGYICFGQTPLTVGTWDIYWLAVLRARRGRGLGKALVTHAEKSMAKARARLIMLETSSKPEYEEARRFHLAQGYEVVGRVPDFYDIGDDKIVYWKRLR